MFITQKQIFQNCRVLKRGLVLYIHNPQSQEKEQEDHLKSQPQLHRQFKASQDYKKSYLKEHKRQTKTAYKGKTLEKKYTLNRRSLNKIEGQRKAINVIVLFKIVSLLVQFSDRAPVQQVQGPRLHLQNYKDTYVQRII